jgi:hypothetical protein
VLGGTGTIIIFCALMFRRRIVSLFSGGRKNIDDIPLDEIEMPFHKW